MNTLYSSLAGEWGRHVLFQNIFSGMELVSAYFILVLPVAQVIGLEPDLEGLDNPDHGTGASLLPAPMPAMPPAMPRPRERARLIGDAGTNGL